MNTNYSPYELPGVTVDLVIFTVSEGLLKALCKEDGKKFQTTIA